MKRYILLITYFTCLALVISCSAANGGGGGGGNNGNNGNDGDLDTSFDNDGIFLFDSQDAIVDDRSARGRTLQEFQQIKDQKRNKLINEMQQTGFNPVLQKRIDNLRNQFDDEGFAIAFDDTNDKILVAGTSEDNNSINLVVIRLEDDGDLDETFNNGNAVIFENVDGNTISVELVQINGDESFTVFGSVEDVNTNDVNFAIFTFNADGSNGQELIENTIDSDAVAGIALDANGNAVVAFDADGDNDGNQDDIVVARFAAGTVDLDATFNNNTGNNVVANSVPENVGVNGAGDIFVCGSQGTSALIAKMDDGGVFDAGFDGANNGNGIVTFVLGASDNFQAIAFDGNDPVVCGFTVNAGITTVLVAKFDEGDGDLDNNFGVNGSTSFEVVAGSNTSIGNALFLDGNDFFVVGVSDDAGTNRGFIALLDDDGVLEDGFGADGFFISEDIGGVGSADEFFAITQDADDNDILAIGTTGIAGQDDDLVVVKVSN